MKNLEEMNPLEKDGAIARLKSQGWQFCTIGAESTRGWSKDKITIVEKYIWFEE